MNKFEQSFNHENVILRDLTLGVISELYRKVRWTNTWHDKEKLVTVPFYYGMATDERFQFDAFVDDIIGDRPELNIDQKPRGHIELANSAVKRNEFTNPNVNLEFYKEENGILKKVKGRFRVLPIQATYKIKIELESEIDMMKCQESLWDWFWVYKYFYVTYKSMRIDCVLTTPDEYQHGINRELDAWQKDNTKKSIETSFDVHAFFPLEPKETKPTLTNCGRAIFKGRMWTLGDNTRKRRFVGEDANKKKK